MNPEQQVYLMDVDFREKKEERRRECENTKQVYTYLWWLVSYYKGDWNQFLFTLGFIVAWIWWDDEFILGSQRW